jgi:hypothetical protein
MLWHIGRMTIGSQSEVRIFHARVMMNVIAVLQQGDFSVIADGWQALCTV